MIHPATIGAIASSYSLAPAGFQPTDIANLSAWFDADDASTITHSSGSVTQWDDKSGNNHDVTSGSSPTTGTRTINSKNALDFVGGDYLSRADALGLTGAPNFTIFAVTDPDVTDASMFTTISDATAGTTLVLSSGTDATSYRFYDGFYAYTGGALGAGQGVTVWQGASGEATSTYSHYLDGGTALSSTSGSGSGSGTITLADDMFEVGRNSGAVGFDGTLGELIIYNAVLSLSEMNQVGNYLATKWGTTWTDITDPDSAISTHTTLSTNLVSFWELEEASGTRTDSHGSNDLTDNNTVGQGTGVQGNAADFEKDNIEWLSITDASQTGLDITGDMTIAGWMNFETLPVSGGATTSLATKYNTASNSSFIIQLRNDGGTYKVRFYNSNDGSALGFHDINLDTLSTGTWYHLAIVYDASASSVEVYQNGVSKGSGSGTLFSSIYNGTSDFMIGRWGGTGTVHDGLIDEVGVWSKTLTSSEVTDLYNSGSGLPY